MPKVPYPYEVNGKLVTGNGSLKIPICSLSNSSLMPSLTVQWTYPSKDNLNRMKSAYIFLYFEYCKRLAY